MSEITSLTLYELIKNIKEKKISSNEAAKSFVDRAEKSKKINVLGVLEKLQKIYPKIICN